MLKARVTRALQARPGVVPGIATPRAVRPPIATLPAMDLTLTPAQAELRDRARAYVVDALQPLEAEFELRHTLSDATTRELKRLAIEARLHGGGLPASAGGQGWTAIEQVLVHEQLGQATGGLWSFIPGAYNALVHCTPEQRRRYLDPSLRGERNGSYAITEPGQGSDARTLAATAVRDAATGEWVLNGEKWFVTGPSDTDFMIFHCHVIEGDERKPTLFLVDYDAPGLEHDRRPRLHPHVRRPASPVRARATSACRPTRCWAAWARPTTLTNEWFVEERLHIGARCAGAMERLLTLAVDWATEPGPVRRADLRLPGRELPAGRLRGGRVGGPAADARDRVAHGQRRGPEGRPCASASLAKLFASEAAWRCADRVVQVFGGRGYMREYPAERYLRELRVDRIWEGTSEIQRLIVARALEKRGVDAVVG